MQKDSNKDVESFLSKLRNLTTKCAKYEEQVRITTKNECQLQKELSKALTDLKKAEEHVQRLLLENRATAEELLKDLKARDEVAKLKEILATKTFTIGELEGKLDDAMNNSEQIKTNFSAEKKNIEEECDKIIDLKNREIQGMLRKIETLNQEIECHVANNEKLKKEFRQEILDIKLDAEQRINRAEREVHSLKQGSGVANAGSSSGTSVEFLKKKMDHMKNSYELKISRLEADLKQLKGKSANAPENEKNLPSRDPKYSQFTQQTQVNTPSNENSDFSNFKESQRNACKKSLAHKPARYSLGDHANNQYTFSRKSKTATNSQSRHVPTVGSCIATSIDVEEEQICLTKKKFKLSSAQRSYLNEI